MTSTGILITVAYGVVVVFGIVVAIAVAASTRSRKEAHPDELAEREKTWLWIIVVTLSALFLATIWFTPYSRSASGDKQVMEVVARQFAWDIKPATIRAGVPVELRLRSLDVNHAFGVYDPAGKLVFQVQVMPQRTQKSVKTFDQPGTYKVLCLEFCGVLHHGMVATFEVRP